MKKGDLLWQLSYKRLKNVNTKSLFLKVLGRTINKYSSLCVHPHLQEDYNKAFK
ncbi:hypothetical protein BTS2_0635 [Bacillus sp. TS-2]|nr:hypothetical protein BTS2_0635 [Bacillus sp. TS-2]